MQNTYIVLGLTPQGLSILRCLGRNGKRVIAFTPTQKAVGYKSRYGEKRVYSSIDDLKIQIKEIVNQTSEKPICFITSGEVLASVLTNFKELYRLCQVSSSPLEVIETLSHKDLMYEIAKKHGMKIAPYRTLDKYQDGDLKFPLMLKRNYEIPLFFKAEKIKDKADFGNYYSRIEKKDRQDVIAQEFIDINPKDLVYVTCQGFFVNGKCAGLFIANQKRRLKKGLTSYIEEIDDPSICEQVRETSLPFMEELKYNGFAEFEFMYDKAKKALWFIEINTRTCGTQSVWIAKCLNINDIIAIPFKFQKMELIDKEVKWMNIVRDIRSRIQNRDLSHLGDIFKCTFDIYCKDDKKPFLSQFIRK